MKHYLLQNIILYQVNERVREYAENSIFGFDFDPDLKESGFE